MKLPSDIDRLLQEESVVIRFCKEADLEHQESRRQYAHTGHIEGDIICVASAFNFLDPSHQRGLVLHELGHLLLIDSHPSHSERDADAAVSTRYRTKIQYVDSEFGRRLQWVAIPVVFGRRTRRAAN